MVRQLQPWHANLNKRQVKSPKVYMRDSGLLHALLGLSNGKELLSHPKVGASWEGYAIEETIQMVRPEAAYFWATQTGAELDLLLIKGGRRYGVEVKFQDAPRMTSSMRTALTDLDLDHLTVLYPSDQRYDQVDGLFILQVRGDPAALAEAVAGRLGEREIDSHVARLRELDGDREVAIFAGAHEEEGLLLHFDRTVSPWKLFVG